MPRNRKGRRAKAARANGARRPVVRTLESWEDARFLNIDLDVRSRRSLAPLAAAWPWAQQPLGTDGKPNPNWLILIPRGNANTAEAAARLLLEHVATLSPVARRCWNQASKRTFDVGVQAGMGARAFEGVQLSPGTILRIASIGARLRVTVYPPERA